MGLHLSGSATAEVQVVALPCRGIPYLAGYSQILTARIFINTYMNTTF